MPVTVITGGTRGIGAAVARILADAGHDLVLSYASRPDRAQTLAGELRDRGARCEVVRADSSDPDDVDALFATALEFGPITGLVNNAGIGGQLRPLADTDLSNIDAVIAINIRGAILCARRAAQLMPTDRGGTGGAIVNVSSAAATLGSPGEYVHYAASKGAVDSLTIGLSKELAAGGVRVNAVSPGIIVTEIHADSGEPGRAERLGPSLPMGRSGEAGEVADAIVWLLSEQASYVTGANLRIAGGR